MAGGPPKTSGLGAVTALSASQAWAAGSWRTENEESGLNIEHWNGTAWTLREKGVSGHASAVFGMDAVTASDVWAVGRFYRPSGGPKSFIQHWDGTAWTRFEERRLCRAVTQRCARRTRVGCDWC